MCIVQLAGLTPGLSPSKTCARFAVKCVAQRSLSRPGDIMLQSIDHQPRAAGMCRRQHGAAANWLLLALVIGILVWWFGGPWDLAPRRTETVQADPRAVLARGSLAEDEQNNIAVFKAASVSTVHIMTTQAQRGFFSLDATQVPKGTGTGFIWDNRGHVVTNFHVIQGGSGAAVTLSDQTTWKAALVGAFPDRDLAVLRIDAPQEKMTPLAVGTSKDLLVGQKVYAIGNPFGLDQTLTTGIISALNREIESVTQRSIRGVIQTDAAINPGNSGGPLLDSAGRLIGVNTAIYGAGTYTGVGFAVPVDTVNRVVPQLIAHGKVVRPGLGVSIARDSLAQRLGLQGVLVIEVSPEGGAAQAGLRPTRRDASGRLVLGDVI